MFNFHRGRGPGTLLLVAFFGSVYKETHTQTLRSMLARAKSVVTFREASALR